MFIKNLNFLIFAIIVFNIFGTSVASKLTVVVNTTDGPVQGEIRKTVHNVEYASFTGIPYAKPPLGDLRFKPPVSVDPWTEVYDARNNMIVCIQYNTSTGAITGSEDCLYINVQTPMVNLSGNQTTVKKKRNYDRKLLSVLFWVYGGAFLTGSPLSESADYYLENDIIFVSLSYRSGVFGYLAIGHPNATGNVGPKDIVFGLKWVQRNIEKFGGDPNNVTLAGGSSGASLVHYVVLSDAAAGLFHGVITVSGAQLCMWSFHSPAEALHYAEGLAYRLGLEWTDKESLLLAYQNVNATAVVNLTTQVATTFGPFRPTIEDINIATDPFLTECSVMKYLRGNFTKVPHILGYMDQETVVFTDNINRVRDTVSEGYEAARKSHQPVYPSVKLTKYLMERSTDFYNDWNYTTIRKFVNDTSEILYMAGIDLTQQMLVAHNDNKPVWYCHFSYLLPGGHHIAQNNTLDGPGHGDDLPYVFYNPTTKLINDTVAQRAVKRVSTMWANFIKHGNPTPHWLNNDLLNITWPESGPLGISLRIGQEFSIGARPIPENAKYWQNITIPHLLDIYACG